jgi:natural product precursor
MKRPKIKLSLNKETIAKLNESEMLNLQGGAGFTAGCTDGCGTIGRTLWNCTKADCTADCATNICDTKLTCTMKNEVADDLEATKDDL